MNIQEKEFVYTMWTFQRDLFEIFDYEALYQRQMLLHNFLDSAPINKNQEAEVIGLIKAYDIKLDRLEDEE